MKSSSLGDDERYAAALAATDIGPARLRRLLQGLGPRQAWDLLAAGAHPEDPEGGFRSLTSSEPPMDIARRCVHGGIDVLVLGAPGYPAALAGDGEAPAVLFSRGDVAVLDGRARVAVVGTRSATPAGLVIAGEIGRTLGAAGVVVVSGLATGIDSAALAGALEPDGPGSMAPVAVLGTAHGGRATAAQRALRDAVAERGAVLSEQAPGSRGARWRFAVRNRIMAALAHVVVVVECHAEGGALHTVRAARRRGVPLAAVPGSPHSAASAGTNALLVDGARCVRGGADVLDLVAEITGHRLRPRSLPAGEPGVAPDPVAGDHQTRALEASAARVLRLLGPDPLDLARLVERAGQPLGFVALALEQLADRGLAVAERGWWRRVPPSGRQR